MRIGYVGVDLFFFLAAYSLADKKLQYGPFLQDRFLRIYLKFVIFAVLAAVYQGWSVRRLLKLLCFVEFLQRGGGSFLWFLPAIMIFYLLYPLFLKVKWQYKPFAVLAAWFVLSFISETVFGYTKCFIFTNRIPVIIVGFWLKERPLKKWIPFACLPVGMIVLYLWGSTLKLNIPFSDFFYILAIFMVIAIAGLSIYIPESRTVTIVGSTALEIYALQMIFGASLVNRMYSATANRLITDILVVAIIVAMAVLLARLFEMTRGKLKSESRNS